SRVPGQAFQRSRPAGRAQRRAARAGCAIMIASGRVAYATYTPDLGPPPHSIRVRSMPDLTPVVYVVDDDLSVRESLELLIRHAGWRPVLLASAQEFLAHAPADVPSCLVLDVSLPDISGLDLQQ